MKIPGATALSIMTFGIMTFIMMTLSINGLFVTFIKNDTYSA